MSKLAKCTTTILLILLSSTILLALSPSALAQTDQAIVILNTAGNGTTNPAPGSYNYASGSAIVLTAIPSQGYVFSHWEITGGYNTANNPPLLIPPDWIDPNTYTAINPDTGEAVPFPQSPTSATYAYQTATQNPLGVLCGFGYTFSYTAVFVPTTPTAQVEATVVVKSAAGGSTTPATGTYTLADGTHITLTAMANSGYVFQYWIASGTGTSGHEGAITDNPLTITTASGSTYDYQPVFAKEGTVTTTTGIPAEYFYAAVIILVILVAAGFGLALMFRRKK